MLNILLVALGGAVGSVLRYLVSHGVNTAIAPRPFPLGTLVVNVVGCFLIGLLMPLVDVKISQEQRMLLVVGLLGGFTTFSAFGWETLAAMNEGAWLRAGMNVLLNNALGLTAAWLGFRVAKTWATA